MWNLFSVVDLEDELLQSFQEKNNCKLSECYLYWPDCLFEMLRKNNAEVLFGCNLVIFLFDCAYFL